MGFTHVLVWSGTFAAHRGPEAHGTTDTQAVGNAVTDVLPSLRVAAQACADHAVQLLLDVDVACMVPDTRLRADQRSGSA